MFGNYDNESALPEFDLYLGANLWDSVVVVSAQSIINKEIVHVPSSDHLHVCLVNTGLGVPFISVLELRPWNNKTYVTTTGSLQLYRRFDFASKNINRVMRSASFVIVNYNWKIFILLIKSEFIFFFFKVQRRCL